MWPGPGPLTELGANRDKEKKDASVSEATSENFHAKHKYGFKEYFADKKAKLQDQFGVDFEGPKKSNIFQGISIFVNGHTEPSSTVLRQMMGEHGGRFDLYEAPETTHWICSWLPHAKVRLLRGTERIIKPSWIIDSIAAGRLLPEADYSLLPDLGFQKPKTSFFLKPPGNNSSSSVAPSTLPSNSSAASAIPPAATTHRASAVPSEHDTDKKRTLTPESPELLPVRAPAPHPVHSLPQTDTKPLIPNANPPAAAVAPLPAVAPALPVAGLTGGLDDKLAAFKTAKDEGFLESYRQSSRLHYLSTWKAQFQESLARELRALLESDNASTPVAAHQDITDMEGAEITAFQLRQDDPTAAPCLQLHSGGAEAGDESDAEQGAEMDGMALAPAPPAKISKSDPVRIVVHCDMDCFFASVAQVSDPALRGKPVIVCHSSVGSATGASDVASASYEARKYGIRNGMSLNRARQLCPELCTASYQFERYAQISRAVYSIFVKYSRRIQAVSCDEAYFELRAQSYAAADEKVKRIREEIVLATGCNASAGLGPNMLVARMATKKAKPNGQRCVPPDRVPSFMASLDVNDIPGVGPALKYSLQLMQVSTVGHLLTKTEAELKEKLGGKMGERLYMAARGIDDRQLQCFNARKSIGVDLNWGVRLHTNQEFAKVLGDLAKELAGRAAQSGVQGRTITLRILQRRAGVTTTWKFLGHGIVDAHSRSVTLRVPTAAQQDLERECMILYRALAIPPDDVRGIGIHITKLSVPGQSSVIPSAPAIPNLAYGRPRQVTLSPVVKKDATGRPPALQHLPAPVRDPNAVVKSDFGPLLLPPVHEVDADVYEALPQDLKDEMEQTYQRNEKREQEVLETQEKPEKKQRKLPAVAISRTIAADDEPEIDVDVLRALPDDLRADVLKTHTISTAAKRKLERPPSPPLPPPPAEPLFAPEQADGAHLARVLRAWIRAIVKPKPVHIELIAQAAVEFVERNAAALAYSLLEALRRHAEEKCEWVEMYNLVLEVVQGAVKRQHRGMLPLRRL